MTPKTNLGFLRSILGSMLSLTALSLFAQEQPVMARFKQQFWAGSLVFVGTVPGSDWRSTAAKAPGSTVALRLLPTDDKLGRLEWQFPIDKTPPRLEIHKAMTPIDAQGNVTIETGATLVVLTDGSTSLAIGALKTNLALPSGYYVVSVTDGALNKSDWLAFQIE
jgi:hypothetical protein